MDIWKFAVSSADDADSSAPILLRGEISSNLILASKLGYQAIEVHTRETARWDFPSIEKVMEENRVGISAIITGRLCTEGKVNLIDDIPYVTQAALDGMKKYIDMAHRLRTDIVIGWVKGRLPEKSNPVKYLDRLAYHLEILDDYAGERDVKIHLEVINRYETNLFNSAAETLEFIEKNKLNHCCVHLDTFHMGIDETDPIAAIRLCGKRLGYMHFADNSRCYPGSGQFDFRKIIQALRNVGYDGYLSVECLPKPDGKTAALKAKEHLLDCITSVENHSF